VSLATKFSGFVVGVAALSVCAIVALSKRRHWLDLATQHLTQRLIRQVERETGLPVARSSRRQWLLDRRQQLAAPNPSSPTWRKSRLGRPRRTSGAAF